MIDIINTVAANVASFLLGIVGGVASSFVYLYVISRIRPSIAISDRIAKGRTPKGHITYSIKILNKTSRPVMNVRAELHRLRVLRPDVKPTVYNSMRIYFVQETPMTIPGFVRGDENAEYAYGFRVKQGQDLDQIWEDDGNSFLRFRIIVTDSLSGFSRLFTQYYREKSSAIMSGHFKHGASFEVLPDPAQPLMARQEEVIIDLESGESEEEE